MVLMDAPTVLVNQACKAILVMSKKDTMTPVPIAIFKTDVICLPSQAGRVTAMHALLVTAIIRLIKFIYKEKFIYNQLCQLKIS
jgi:hypothetical protein